MVSRVWVTDFVEMDMLLVDQMHNKMVLGKRQLLREGIFELRGQGRWTETSVPHL